MDDAALYNALHFVDRIKLKEIRKILIELRKMITDTHQNTEKFLIENYRKKTFSEKMRMIKEITIACQKMALSGIKQRYPNADTNELRLRLGALWLDKETMLKVYGWNVKEKRL